MPLEIPSVPGSEVVRRFRFQSFLLFGSLLWIVGSAQESFAQAQADKTPPVLEELSVQASGGTIAGIPTVDVRSSPGKVTFTARVTDDISGVKLVSVFLVNPLNLTQELCSGERTSGDEMDGEYVCEVEVPQNSPDGAWVINFLLTDQTDNPGLVTGNALTALGAPTTIAVLNVNLPPALSGDEYTTAEDSVLTVEAAESVLANDTDDGGGTLEAILAKEPENGTLDFAADGTFTYTPAPDFFGTDDFVYQASDGDTLSDSIDVAIEVTAVNDPPVVPDASVEVAEDVPQVIVLEGTDVEEDAITYRVSTAPMLGAVTIEGDRATYRPNDGVSGQDSFGIIGSDGTDDSEEATISITIESRNDAPSTQSDSYSTAEDTPLEVDSATGVLANDSDADGNALQTTLTGSTRNGSLVLAEDGGFTYTPDQDFHGEDGFTYSVSDGVTNSPDVAVTISVEAVNDVPSAENLSLVLAQGRGTVELAGTDVDGDVLAFEIVAGPDHGSASISGSMLTYEAGPAFPGSDRLTYIATDGGTSSPSAEVLVSGGAAAVATSATVDDYVTDEDQILTVDASTGVLANDSGPVGLTAAISRQPTSGSLTLGSDGSFEYRPNPDFFGTDTFRYQAISGSASSEAVVSVRVRPVNDAPSMPLIVYPSNGATLILSGDPDREFAVQWSSSTDPENDAVTYRWELVDDVGGTLLSGLTGSSTEVRHRHGDLAAALTASGLPTGTLTTLVHWVMASDGTAEVRSRPFEIRAFRGAVTGTETSEELPDRVMLGSNYPNPFNPTTVLRFGLPAPGAVRLRVIDPTGRTIRVVADGEFAAGWHALPFHARGIASGIYLQVLEVSDTRLAGPIIVSK